eukprot:5059873-Alexandrium_andersonii.AAC.1
MFARSTRSLRLLHFGPRPRFDITTDRPRFRAKHACPLLGACWARLKIWQSQASDASRPAAHCAEVSGFLKFSALGGYHPPLDPLEWCLQRAPEAPFR